MSIREGFGESVTRYGRQRISDISPVDGDAEHSVVTMFDVDPRRLRHPLLRPALTAFPVFGYLNFRNHADDNAGRNEEALE
jgi:hypothetical protein